jgi:hypothetical protein
LAVQVKQIQEEYQSYMEGVRARAQGAIDQANALFQAFRGEATSHLDAAIHYLQSRFFSYAAVSPQGMVPVAFPGKQQCGRLSCWLLHERARVG